MSQIDELLMEWDKRFGYTDKKLDEESKTFIKLALEQTEKATRERCAVELDEAWETFDDIHTWQDKQDLLAKWKKGGVK